MKYGFVIDNRVCIGCHACTVACKAEHNVPLGVNRTWVKYVEKGVFPHSRRVFSVHRCNHCSDPPCVEICPVSSLFLRDDGIVDFDSRRCIGCKACMQACPYDALYIDPETHTSAKCNYCAHRVDVGLEPACVNVCPVHAIISGDMEDAGSEISRLLSRQQISVRKPEKNTRPNLFYIDGDSAALRPEEAGPQLDYLTTSQATGVGHFAGYAARKSAVTRPAARANMLAFSAREGASPGPEDGGAGAPARRTYDVPNKGMLWGWEVSGYLWSKGISAGVLFLPLLLEFAGWLTLPERTAKALVLVSLAFLAVTGGLLVKDLDRPERFLYVLLRPQWRSWLVRGAYIISAYGAASALWALHLFAGLETPATVLLPLLLPLLKGALVVLGILTAVYTAFLFAQAKGRDFWQSPLLPLHMLVQSTIAGGAVALVIEKLAGSGMSTVLVHVLQAGLLLHLALLLIEFKLPHVTRDTAAVIAAITRGPLRYRFWSSILLGHLLPLALLWAGSWARPDALILPACALVLIFVLVIEQVWVRAPQLIPLS